VTCSANPSTVTAGGSATITAKGVSPQNRPLTYTFSSSAGTVSGSGSTAILSTTGAPAGTITVDCTATDDKSQSAKAQADVNAVLPPTPVKPVTQALCTTEFARDKKRPTRVDNEAKACLDGIALTAKRDSSATLVLVGNASKAPHGASTETVAAQRALNVKEYLSKEQGIDSNRIQVRTGNAGTDVVADYLVPVGADFANDVPQTKPIAESTLKPQSRLPLHHGKAHKRKK
jgi:outer membrane protein OmpA-like peptidoglycan-associated protein